MNYQTYTPHDELASIINCYWTLEVPTSNEHQKQRIIPDGMIEMAFILGDDIMRYTTDNDYILQPRSMVLGQITKPFYIQPTGAVNTFAIRFYPYGFAHFINTPLKELLNKENPLEELFGHKTASTLTQEIIDAEGTQERISIIEGFLLNRLKESSIIDTIVKTTIDTLLSSHGSTSIHTILKGDLSKRRQLERKFVQQIGMSPKQLGKVIRLQTALKHMLHASDSLTNVAYQSEYYDQAHFNKDFKEFTGVNPKEFLGHENMTLSTIFYS